MIYGPKNSPPKFHPSIRSKSVRIKTRAKRYSGYDVRCVPLSALVLIRAGLLRIKGSNFGGEFFGTTNHKFFAKGWKSVDFRPP
jgi:uncharacterized membrane protein